MSMNFVSAAKVHFGFLEPSKNNQRERKKKVQDPNGYIQFISFLLLFFIII
jgi:hypothetical protein